MAWPNFTGQRAVFAMSAVCYIGVSLWFWQHDLIPGDAVSRVANSYYVLYSRDPHLAAIGFVWNPLPSLVLLPALPLKAVFPPLTLDGLVGALSSALFMAGVVAISYGILRQLQVPPPTRKALTILLALHPMIVSYAGNGMSEACFLFFLVLSVSSLLRWLATPRPESLVTLGLGLGLAYGARYEAIAPGVVVPAAVVGVSWWRGRHHPDRLAAALADSVLTALPFLFSVVLWATTSKIIVDQWFATFESEYGNSAQVSKNLAGIESITGASMEAKMLYGLQQLLGLAPVLPVLLLVAAIVAVRRRDSRTLAPLAILGSVLLFNWVAFVAGGSFGWLRFQIAAVPLSVLLMGILLTAAKPATAAAASRGRTAWRTVVAVTAASIALPTAVLALRSPTLAREESEVLAFSEATSTAELTRLNRQVARDLDRMALPEGSVIVDSAYASPIILASEDPRQFVINSDRDFRAALADPRDHSVKYLLISTNGASDAVRRAYPSSIRHIGGGSQDVVAPNVRAWTDNADNVLWLLAPVSNVSG